MGAYLSEPKVDKESEDESNKYLRYGACSMQGWRMEQEDAHNAILKFETENFSSLFAVYDGHGGPEVSKYCANNLPNFLKTFIANENITQIDDMKDLLRRAFIKFDSELTKPEIIEELRNFTKLYENDKNESSEAEEETHDDHNVLLEEATAPLEDVLEKQNVNSVKQVEESKRLLFTRMRRLFFEEDVIENDKVVSTKIIESVTVDKGDSTENKSKEENKTDSSISQPSGDNLKEEESSDDDEDEDFQLEEEAEEETSEEDESEEDEEQNESEDENSEDEEKEEEEDDDEEEEELDPNSIAYSPVLWKSVMNAAKRAVILDGEASLPGEDSGSTAVLALLRPEWKSSPIDEDQKSIDQAVLRLYVANAGDSRCVLSRNGTAVEMSHDHKPDDAKELKRINRAGGTVTSEGRVNGGLNLSRAIGDHTYKKNESLPLQKQMITALPDVLVEEIKPEDEFFVLACDGIWNSMSSQEVIDFVRERLNITNNHHKNGNGVGTNGTESSADKQSSTPHLANETDLSKICEELFEYCLAPDTSGDGTGCDNMTAVIVLLKNVKSLLEDWCSQSTVTLTNRKRKVVDNGSLLHDDENQGNDENVRYTKRAKLDTEDESAVIS